MGAYRDSSGHFISEEEARRRGLVDEPATEPEEGNEEDNGNVEDPIRSVPAFGAEARQQEQENVFVDTGRGQGVEVPAGSPFVPTLERLADDAHYGGYFRIFLNGRECLANPWLDEAHTIPNPDTGYPQTIEPGMRLAITSYDKVG